jgi:hypothetical protein
MSYLQSGNRRVAGGQYRWVGWMGDNIHVVFVQKVFQWKMMQCHNATVSYFVTKVWGKVFAYFQGVAIKCDSSMQNWLFGLPGGIIWWCSVIMQQPVLLSPKSEAKSLHVFMQLPWNVTAVCRIDCLAYQEELFLQKPLDVKKKIMSMLLNLASTCFSFLSLGEFGLLHGEVFCFI